MQFQQTIQRLEIERDHYRKEYINCRDEQRKTSEKDNVNIKFEKNARIKLYYNILFVTNYRLSCGHEFVN